MHFYLVSFEQSFYIISPYTSSKVYITYCFFSALSSDDPEFWASQCFVDAGEVGPVGTTNTTSSSTINQQPTGPGRGYGLGQQKGHGVFQHGGGGQGKENSSAGRVVTRSGSSSRQYDGGKGFLVFIYLKIKKLLYGIDLCLVIINKAGTDFNMCPECMHGLCHLSLESQKFKMLTKTHVYRK